MTMDFSPFPCPQVPPADSSHINLISLSCLEAGGGDVPTVGRMESHTSFHCNPGHSSLWPLSNLPSALGSHTALSAPQIPHALPAKASCPQFLPCRRLFLLCPIRPGLLGPRSPTPHTPSPSLLFIGSAAVTHDLLVCSSISQTRT